MNPTGAVPTTVLEARPMTWMMPPADALPSCPVIEKPKVPARFKCIRPATMAVKGIRLKRLLTEKDLAIDILKEVAKGNF
jgi:hypothetical protein